MMMLGLSAWQSFRFHAPQGVVFGYSWRRSSKFSKLSLKCLGLIRGAVGTHVELLARGSLKFRTPGFWFVV